jgi:chorismate mutase/prephenate dehydratase
MSITKLHTNKVTISIQGKKNSYHYEAALKLAKQKPHIFGNGQQLKFIFCSSFEDTIKELKSGKASFSLLAIENGIHGHIYQTLDIIMQNKPKIIADIYLPIHHQLASYGNSLGLITDVYSHFVAFSQCSNFLDDKLGAANRHNVEDTAWAAIQTASKKIPSAGVICSREAAKANKLNILAKNIENFNDNVTRFFLLSLNDFLVDDKIAQKTSLILTTNQVSGALYKALGCFYHQNLNLTSLTSRPGDGGAINYKFYIELETSSHSKAFQKAIEDIKVNKLGEIEVLGCY